MPKVINKFRSLRGEICKAGYTDKEFSEAIGIHYRTLSGKLCGRYHFQLDEIYRSMDFLKIPYNQMHIYFPKDGIDQVEIHEASVQQAQQTPPAKPQSQIKTQPFKKLHVALESANISCSDLSQILRRSIEYMNECFAGERAFSILEAYTILEALKISSTKFPEYFPKSDLPNR